MSCVVKTCNQETRKKAIMCGRHWALVPLSLRLNVRTGTEKGLHSLRAQPSREWLLQAEKYVGEIKSLMVRVDSAQRVTRTFQPTKPEPRT